jgi:hypothetical protein
VADAKSGRRVFLVLAVIGAAAVAVLLLLVSRSGEAGITDSERKEQDRHVVEMVRPGDAASRQASSEVAPQVTPQATPSQPDDSSGRPSGAGDALPVFKELSLQSAPPDLTDLIVATRKSGAASVGVVPRSSVTGTPVVYPTAPDVSPVMKAALEFVLGTGEDVPLSGDGEYFVENRVTEIRKEIGEVVTVFYLDDGSSDGHFLCLDRRGAWWHLWLTFQGGRLSDLEYTPADL